MLLLLHVPERPDSAPILLLNKNRQGLGQDTSCGKVIFKRHASGDKAGIAPGYTALWVRIKTPTSGLPPSEYAAEISTLTLSWQADANTFQVSSEPMVAREA
ncbi:hypothetical protein KOW79_007773 [Hemibagrus wyckioides]|uniref:Uncharacterized protein n=1 Tax=Hemibagrus wyckioides TaxID=337641 RepID=A0A9D3SRX9_9TELE|nr:hypothetical protein KOW79_007773 [Hemibagrus wyckioides]